MQGSREDTVRCCSNVHGTSATTKPFSKVFAICFWTLNVKVGGSYPMQGRHCDHIALIDIAFNVCNLSLHGLQNASEPAAFVFDLDLIT